jgi:hypothetical protein
MAIWMPCDTRISLKSLGLRYLLEFATSGQWATVPEQPDIGRPGPLSILLVEMISLNQNRPTGNDLIQTQLYGYF